MKDMARCPVCRANTQARHCTSPQCTWYVCFSHDELVIFYPKRHQMMTNKRGG